MADHTDRELLELAAKAAGIAVHRGNLAHQADMVFRADGGMYAREWNPLTDDGDALRLAVKLRLVIQHARKYVVVLGCDRDVAEHQDTRENGGDEAAATRRAIVRAAAEIGRSA